MKNHLKALAAAAILCQALLVAPAFGGCPFPSRCYVSPRLLACPAGDSAFVVIARYASGIPWPGWVALDFRDCPGFRFARLAGSEPYEQDSSAHRIWRFTDGWGVAEFPIHAGGAFESGIVRVLACQLTPGDTVLADWLSLGTRPVAALDRDGDLVVGPNDVDLLQSKLGATDPSADLDGDGQVTAADVAIVQAHLGHRALESTTAVPRLGDGGLALSAPQPNPFRSETRFILTLERAGQVDVSLYDLSGRRVGTIFRGDLSSGSHDFAWHGRSTDGSAARSGVYWIQVRVAGTRLARRAVFLGGH